MTVPFVFRREAIVVAIGQDALVANLATYIGMFDGTLWSGSRRGVTRSGSQRGSLRRVGNSGLGGNDHWRALRGGYARSVQLRGTRNV